MNRRLLRAVFYLGPLFLWLVVLFVLGTRYGQFTESFDLYKGTISLLVAPVKPPDDNMFLIAQTALLRRLASIVCYGVLTVLLVRALQWGRSRLQGTTVTAALLLALVFAVLDTLHKEEVPGRHGSLSDVVLDMAGVGLFLGGALLFFGIKSLERRLLAEKASSPSHSPGEGTS